MKRRSLPSRLPKLRIAAFAPLTVLLGMPLAYGATNLALSNGTFDTGTSPWVIAGNAISAPIGATACGSTKCLQLNIDKATVTATSEGKTNASPGEFVTATAMMKRTSVTGPEDVSLGIVFYNADKAPIGTTTWSHAAGPADTWGSVKVSAIAPPGTVTTKVVVRGKSTGTLTAHVDNVVLSKMVIEDKGAQVSIARISAVALDIKTNSLYVAANGHPAKFFDYRFLETTPPKEFTLGNEEIWSVVVGGDSTAYFGTASGKFYKYDYTKNTPPVMLREFKKTESGTRAIWSLKAGPNNCIYGGLEPDGTKTDGFKYCGQAGEPTLMTLATNNGTTPAGYHVRSLAVDPGETTTAGSVYWGMGIHARVHKTGLEQSNVDGPVFRDETKDYAYYTDFAKDRLFVRVTGTNSNQTLVMDRAGGIAGATVEKINSIGISPVSPYMDSASLWCKSTVFYTKDLGKEAGGSHLSSYCLDDTGKETALKIQMSAPAAFAYAPAASPTQLVSVLRDPVAGKGQIVRFNLADLHKFEPNSAKRVPTEFTAPITATGLRTLAVHGDKTYVSGFVNGDIAVSDGTTKPPVLVKEPLQAEGMVILGKHLYIGGYPEAVLKSFELTDTGLLGAGSANDKTLGDAYGQNRPFAMLGMPAKTTADADRLVIATVPKKGEQSALAVYTVGARFPWSVVKEPFKGQSILALAKIDDVVYGGTSVWRDKDDEKSTGAAKLFRFKPLESLVTEEIPFEPDSVTQQAWSKSAITALLAVNKQIWILAEDTVLIYDHATNKFVKKLQIDKPFSYAAWTNAWNAGSMVESNGYVYFSANDTYRTNLYRVNISKPDSIEMVRFDASGMLKVDAQGNIYFLNGEKVMKFNPALQ